MDPHERMMLALELTGLMALTVMVLAVCATIVAWVAFRREGGAVAGPLSQMVGRIGALQLLTVQVIVTSVLILRIIDELNAEATVSVLSGIAGYVLGGIGRSGDRADQRAPD